MLEAARLASHWGNVQAVRCVVIDRFTAPKEVLDALPVGTAIAGFQFRLAPVVLVWYIDYAAIKKQGDRLHELVDAGAIGVNVEKSHKYLDETLIPFFQGAEEAIKAGGITEVDAGQAIAQATLVAFEEGLGTCCLGLPAQKKMKRVLKLPADSKICVIQTVGYPAEDATAGWPAPASPLRVALLLQPGRHSLRAQPDRGPGAGERRDDPGARAARASRGGAEVALRAVRALGGLRRRE
jgi:nitroreductase